MSVLTGLLVAVALSWGAIAVFQPGCNACHMQAGTFRTQTLASPHAKNTCVECHGGSTVQTRAEFATTQMTGMVLKVVPVDPTVSAVPSSRCLSCHKEAMVQRVERNGLRIIHKSCMVGRQCTDCHSTTAHGTAVSWPKTSTMEMCFDCHGSRDIPSKCDTCHQAKLPRDRIRTGTFAVTHGRNYLKTHGLAPMRTCTPCHTEDKCQKCHGAGLPHAADFVRTHPKAATSKQAKCTMCHKKEFCSDCHVYAMPHNKSFRQRHGRIVARDGKQDCYRCHDKGDCVACHEKHVHPVTIDQLRALGVDLPEGGSK